MKLADHQCAACRNSRASRIIVAVVDSGTRETYLCHECAGVWRFWRQLIYGPTSLRRGELVREPAGD